MHTLIYNNSRYRNMPVLFGVDLYRQLKIFKDFKNFF